MDVRFGIMLLAVALVFAVDQVSSEEINADTMVRREADPGMVSTLLSLIPGIGKREANPEPLNAKALIEEIKKRLGRSSEAMSMARERRNPDPSILDVITDAVNSAMNSMG